MMAPGGGDGGYRRSGNTFSGSASGKERNLFGERADPLTRSLPDALQWLVPAGGQHERGESGDDNPAQSVSGTFFDHSLYRRRET